VNNQLEWLEKGAWNIFVLPDTRPEQVLQDIYVGGGEILLLGCRLQSQACGVSITDC
jgi:hypothetical protein